MYPTSEELVMRISLVARSAPLWISSAPVRIPGGVPLRASGARSSTFSDVGHYCEEVAVGAASPELVSIGSVVLSADPQALGNEPPPLAHQRANSLAGSLSARGSSWSGCGHRR